LLERQAGVSLLRCHGYEKIHQRPDDACAGQGIKDGAPTNKQKGPAFKTELATAYPECRLVATKETMSVEGMIKIVYDLLKDKLYIVKLTFTSGVNGATEEYEPRKDIERCPLCGIALNENGVCPKCGYKK
jgi:6-pyruvoyltetrahydropterin/6-carboxytetrahydropterin synthase